MVTSSRKVLEDSIGTLVDMIGADTVLEVLISMMPIKELNDYVDWLYDYLRVYGVID